ncbi:MAG: LPXTG cell wall anchor domain-containing protein [Candidatus Nanoarchaeia archaeon]
MKKELILFIFILLLASISAEECLLEATLVNQDPYPAQPGEYVELVFQLSGVDNSDCQGAIFELEEAYPFEIGKNQQAKRELPASTYIRDYKTSWMIPYDLIVDKDVVAKEYQLDVRYASGKSASTYIKKTFNISVDDARVDFEVSIDDYSQQEVTFQILNIEDSDAEAVTIEIPQQENIIIKGARRNIIGDLDSNEYTTGDFQAIAQEGYINLIIRYTDEIGVRRQVEKQVYFNSDDFKQEEQGINWLLWIILILVVVGGFWFWRKKKKK